MKKLLSISLLFLMTLPYAPAVSAADFNFPIPASFFNSPIFNNLRNVHIEGQYKKNKNLVKLEFSNLKEVKKIDYTLIYIRDGVEDAAMDSLSPNGKNTVKKEIFLGTCSSTTCVAHNKITKITLEVNGTYNDGKTFTKTVNIKP